jgi:hypothetical protein
VEATSKNFDAGIVNESTEEEDRQKHNYKKGFDSNPAHFTLRLLEGLVVVLENIFGWSCKIKTTLLGTLRFLLELHFVELILIFFFRGKLHLFLVQQHS